MWNKTPKLFQNYFKIIWFHMSQRHYAVDTKRRTANVHRLHRVVVFSHFYARRFSVSVVYQYAFAADRCSMFSGWPAVHPSACVCEYCVVFVRPFTSISPGWMNGDILIETGINYTDETDDIENAACRRFSVLVLVSISCSRLTSTSTSTSGPVSSWWVTGLLVNHL